MSGRLRPIEISTDGQVSSHDKSSCLTLSENSLTPCLKRDLLIVGLIPSNGPVGRMSKLNVLQNTFTCELYHLNHKALYSMPNLCLARQCVTLARCKLLLGNSLLDISLCYKTCLVLLLIVSLSIAPLFFIKQGLFLVINGSIQKRKMTMKKDLFPVERPEAAHC